MTCLLYTSSLVNLYEVSVEALQDKLHFKRVAAVAVIAVIGTAGSLCIQAIVSDWRDEMCIRDSAKMTREQMDFVLATGY